MTDLFPRGGDVARAEFWSGLRPMTPDGTPVIGADALAEPLSRHRPRHAGLDHGGGHRPRDRRPDLGPPPEIDLAGLTIERYRGGAAA